MEVSTYTMSGMYSMRAKSLYPVPNVTSSTLFLFVFSSSSSSFKLFDAVRAYVFKESGGQLYHPGTLNRTPFETDQVFTGKVRTRRLRYLPVCARTYLLLPLLLLSCPVQVSGV